MSKCNGELVQALKDEVGELRNLIHELSAKLICSCGHEISRHVGAADSRAWYEEKSTLEVGVCTANVQVVDPTSCQCKMFELRKLHTTK